MEPGKSTVVCCAADQQLSADDAGALLCHFEGSDVAGELQNGHIVCDPPAEALAAADVEQQRGLRLRVSTRGGRTLHEGVYARLSLAGGGDAKAAAAAAVGAAASAAAAAAPPTPPPGRAPSRLQTLRRQYGALRPFAIISCSYLLFTITDGAVRMIVLLHAYSKGFSAMEVAVMFTLYEAAGVATNLAAGLAGARWGIKTTLLAGLGCQLVGLGMLFGWQDGWPKATAIAYVTASQAMCGVAKDLTKLGGKTVTKLVTPAEKQSALFRLVAALTGWKNSLKGAGYFLGAATVGASYYLSLSLLVGLVLAAVPWAAVGLSNQLGRARRENVALGALFAAPRNVAVLSASRVFLFGARDLWFEVPLPFFLRSAESGLGWSRAAVGAFLAAFIIAYGQVQSWTPQLVLGPLRQSPPDKYAAFWWCAALAAPTAALAGAVLGSGLFGPGAAGAGGAAALTALLGAFCVVFAVNSAVHSYLIVRYSDGDKVAMSVGVYYASNAVGRLAGTLASGALYSYVGPTVVDGFGACLLASTAASLASAAVDAALHEDRPGATWWAFFNRCVPRLAPPPDGDAVEAHELRKMAAARREAAAAAAAPAELEMAARGGGGGGGG